MSHENKYKTPEGSSEGSSFDLEENMKNNATLPSYWPVGGRIYGKFKREPLHLLEIYGRGPIVSDLYPSQKAVVTRMYVNFRES